jgi:hypothetical protein
MAFRLTMEVHPVGGNRVLLWEGEDLIADMDLGEWLALAGDLTWQSEEVRQLLAQTSKDACQIQPLLPQHSS